MNSNTERPPDERELEQFIGGVLHQQPLRQAPASLEAAILRRLAAEAARPWWLQGFNRWPWIARGLFLALSAGLVWLSYTTTARLGSVWQAAGQSAPANAARAGMQMFVDLSQALQTLGGMVTRDISPLWIYGSAGLALLLYAALFGLGAAAFRTLIDINPESARY